MGKTAEFFETMAERQRIYARKERGDPKPWTSDPIFQRYKFTNVFREQDAVTRWIRENWREPYANHPNLWIAMCIARTINLPEVLEDLGFPGEVWTDDYLDHMTRVLEARRDAGKPQHTGAYMIRAESDPGKSWYSWSKGAYLAHIVIGRVWKDFGPGSFRDGLMAPATTDGKDPKFTTLQEAHEALTQYHGWGPFMAYEVVTDLRHTRYLRDAEDIYLWANPGPGAMRGLNRIHNRPLKKGGKAEKFVAEMRDLLRIAPDYLPEDFPALEMRDIEHWLCEFDKYERAANGEGKPRSRYPGEA